MMKKLLFLVFFVLAIACNSDENNQPAKTAQNLVTGINMRQNFDDTMYTLGNPNVLTGGKFVIYPNPANDVVIVMAEENISDVWIVPANADKIYQDEDFTSILNSGLYTAQSIVSNAQYSLNGQSAMNTDLDISNLEEGYYRIFVKIDGEIYWDNLYKYGGDGDNAQQFAAILNFWE